MGEKQRGIEFGGGGGGEWLIGEGMQKREDSWGRGYQGQGRGIRVSERLILRVGTNSAINITLLICLVWLMLPLQMMKRESYSINVFTTGTIQVDSIYLHAIANLYLDN